MNNVRFQSALAGVAVLLAAGSVHAAVVSGSIAPLAGFSTYDLDGGDPATTSDWIIYGARNGAPVSTALDRTTKAAVSSFSPLTVGGGVGPAIKTTNGVNKYQHDAAFGSHPSATSSSDYYPVVATRGSDILANPSLTFTHTLLGESETLDIFLLNTAGAQGGVDLSATVSSGGSYSISNVEFGYSRTDGGRSGNYGILTLDISEAVAGDVLTFTISTDFSGETAVLNDYGVGISAARVTATDLFIPEPTSLALLGGGGLLMLRRRK